MSKVELNSLMRQDLELLFQKMNEPSYRGRQLYQFMHQQSGSDIEGVNVFSKDLKKKVSEVGYISKTFVFHKFKSEIDGTRKYVLELDDGNIIESVFMNYTDRATICLSTQVGCKMGCSFCASTKNHFERNLTPGEMLSQVYTLEKDQKKKINNIVLMGIGEPLDNYDNILRFLRMIGDSSGRNLSLRNITISTCGIVPGILRLAEENLPINLAISLHYPFDEERVRFMPIAKKYSIQEIISASKYYFQRTSRRVSFEYVLVQGINDSVQHAEELKRLLRGTNSHVNLIPLNSIKEFAYSKTSLEQMHHFKHLLEQNGITTTVRKSMGADIEAACGQLRDKYDLKRQVSE